VGDIDFKVISATKNSNKFQKTKFWKEKLVEDMVALEGLPFNSHGYMKNHILAQYNIHIHATFTQIFFHKSMCNEKH
jgi:hypothetical protein